MLGKPSSPGTGSGDKFVSPRPCSRHAGRGSLVPGVLPGVGGGTAEAVLAQLLQAESPLAELGEPWPPVTPSLPLFTARISFPRALAGLRGAVKPPGSSVGNGGPGGLRAAVVLGRAAGVLLGCAGASVAVFLLEYERSHSSCCSRAQVLIWAEPGP